MGLVLGGITVTVESIKTPEDCTRCLAEIYKADVSRDKGIIHVTSAWRESPELLCTLRIGPDTPRSVTDAFLLNAARARADAIVTTGKILRDEPGVSYDLGGPREVPQALMAWRRKYIGKVEPPARVLLTSGRDIDWRHPFFGSDARILITTSMDSARALDEKKPSDRVEVVGRKDLSLPDIILYLSEQRSLENILIEAGPSTSRALYEPPIALDELLLSVHLEPFMRPSARGLPFVAPERLFEIFHGEVTSYSSREESGMWLFQRYRR